MLPVASTLSASELTQARHAISQIDPVAAVGLSQLGRLSESDLNILSRYALAVFGANAVDVRTASGRLDARATLQLPRWATMWPFGGYINVRATLLTTSDLPSFSDLQIGAVSVPRQLANALLTKSLEWLDGGNQRAKGRLLERVTVYPGRVDFVYRWSRGAVERLGARLLSDVQPQTVRRFHDRLRAWVSGKPADKSVRVVELLASLMRHGQRDDSSEPRAENIAAVLVCAHYVSGRGLGRLIPESKTWPAIPRRRVLLRKRVDFAQHFCASAAVAALGGTRLADAIGVYKEVRDSATGSGFSFPDIVADRAGTRFGELASRPASAERLQRQVSTLTEDQELMPKARDLPERMSAKEFASRFGQVGSDRYIAVRDEIERRVNAIGIYAAE